MVHAPGHLREAFQLLVDEAVDGAFSEEYDEVFYDEPLPREQLLWKMANCSDIMPSHICEELKLPQGATYSMGTGAFIALHGLPEQ